MQNKFCKALSNAVSFRVPGDSNTITFNPCCVYNQNIPYHPTLFKKHRSTFVNSDNDYLPGCNRCELKENTHGLENTLRHVFNQQIPDNIGSEIYKLEIVLDTTCNAACIQCGWDQSSLWRNEIVNKDKNYIHIQPTSQIESKIEIIKQSVDIQKVKRWHFWGGEPLLTDTHLKFLNQIEDLSSISVVYTTNGSIFPDDRVLEIWSKCKEIVLNISADGIEDKFHYCRWPLRWDKWTRNVLRFRNETSPNIRCDINYCVMPINALYVDELSNWVQINFSKQKNGEPVNIDFIRSEGIVDASMTPMSLREEVWRKLGEEHVVSNLLKELPVQDYTDMVAHFDYWDNVRKLSWEAVFPETVRHFK